MKISSEKIYAYLKDEIALPEGEVDDKFVIEREIGRDITITNLAFNERVLIRRHKTELPIQFFNCTFNSYVNIESGSHFSNLNFVGCIFFKKVEFNDFVIGNFELADCFFKKGFSSQGLFASKLRLELIRSENAKFTFYKPQFLDCQLSKLIDSSEFLFSGFNKKTERDTASYVKSLSIRCGVEFKGGILFIGIPINYISLSGYNKEGRFNFQNISVDYIQCTQFVNAGFLNVAGLKANAESKIYLYQSNLGKCEIFDVDFSQFKSIAIANSTIHEMVPNNIIWCKKIETEMVSFKPNYLYLREGYRQLKNIMIRINDKVEELQYHKLEMDAYYGHLKISKGNYGEKFIMWTNRVSNNHGLSWTRAFCWIMGLSILVFNFNKFLLGYNSFEPSLFWGDAASWLLSINPVRKFSDVYNDSGNGWQYGLAIFIDVFFRIIYSYLIFQFISAFRKYVKK